MSIAVVWGFLRKLLSSKIFWLVVAASVAMMLHTNAINNAVERTNQERDDLEALAKAEIEAEAKIKSNKNAAEIAEAANKSFIQGQKDAKTINDLRGAVRNGSLQLRQYKASCSADSTNTVADSSERNATDRTNSTRITEDSERIIRITEIGLNALKNWEEAQGVIRADRGILEPKGAK